jgi:photosystem II stability/assembly factor-like uncharacterized protein
VSPGGAVAVGGAGTVGGTAAASAGTVGEGGEMAAGAGAEASGAGAGAGGEGGAPCEADECPAWVPVAGELPPAYSYVIAAAANEVGTVYTGNDGYGSVYKTTTSGASWSLASTGIDEPGVRALAVDPFDASYVWAGNLSGLYRSSNAGGRWSKLNVAADFPQVEWITTDPVVKGRVYVLLNQVSPSWGVAYASDDRGLTWRKLGMSVSFRGHTLDVDTSDPKHLFLGTYGQGVFESHDGGASFQAMAGPPGKQIYQVIYEPTSKVLCAVAENGIARSVDGGASWQTQQGVLAYLMTLAPGPTLYVDGTPGVFRSTDCSNWTRVDEHGGYHAVVDAAGAVYTATTGGDGFQGVRRSPDGVSPFVNVNRGITTSDVTDLALDTSATDGLFVSVRYSGIYHSIDGAASFSSATGNLPSPGTTLIPDGLVSRGKTLFAFTRAYAGRFFRSNDQGSTWTTTLLKLPNNGFAFATAVLPSPTFETDNIVYLGTRTLKEPVVGFEQSLDGGLSFTPRGNADFRSVSMIWDKTHEGWLWTLGAKGVSGVQDERLYLSQDTGLNWSAVPLPVQGTYYGQVVAAVTPSGEVLYVTVGGQGVLRSDDSGSTWQLVGAPPGDILHRLAVDPTDAQTLYAVTGPNELPTPLGDSLFKSRDGGATWSRADRGLPPGIISSLLIEPNSPQIVYAGLAHGGLYKTTSGGE